jgi:RNA polymerase sigma-70 factor (ECF subfamily)
VDSDYSAAVGTVLVGFALLMQEGASDHVCFGLTASVVLDKNVQAGFLCEFLWKLTNVQRGCCVYRDEDVFVNKGCKASSSDIERLVEASQAGGRSAFDELVRLYQRRAMQVAVRMLGDANEAAEAVQNAFVKAYLGIDKLREPGRFEVWLLRIVTNAAISQRRAAKRRANGIKVTDCHEDNGAVSLADKAIGEELKEAIRAAMGKLSKKEAKAISLFGLEGLSQREVAEIMGCSVTAVGWYVFEGRQKLKTLLKEYL